MRQPRKDRSDATPGSHAHRLRRRSPHRAPAGLQRTTSGEVPGERSADRRDRGRTPGLEVRREHLPLHRPQRRRRQGAEGLRPGAGPVRPDDPRLLRPEGAYRGHGRRRRAGRVLLPVVPRILRRIARQGRRQGTRPAVRRGVERLQPRGVVRLRSRPLHPVGHGPVLERRRNGRRDPTCRGCRCQGHHVPGVTGAARTPLIPLRPLGTGVERARRDRSADLAPLRIVRLRAVVRPCRAEHRRACSRAR